MPVVQGETTIRAPIERCFDLARDAELHVSSMAYTDERIVRGRTSGLFEMGEEVTFEASHFGVRQRLTSRIEVVDPPVHFRDVMVEGAFKSFAHDHFFQKKREGTLMVDVIVFEAPLAPLAWLGVNRILHSHLRHLIKARQEAIKEAAE